MNRVVRCLRANGYERIQVRDPARKDVTGKGRRVWVYRAVSPVWADDNA